MASVFGSLPLLAGTLIYFLTAYLNEGKIWNCTHALVCAISIYVEERDREVIKYGQRKISCHEDRDTHTRPDVWGERQINTHVVIAYRGYTSTVVMLHPRIWRNLSLIWSADRSYHFLWMICIFDYQCWCVICISIMAVPQTWATNGLSLTRFSSVWCAYLSDVHFWSWQFKRGANGLSLTRFFSVWLAFLIINVDVWCAYLSLTTCFLVSDLVSIFCDDVHIWSWQFKQGLTDEQFTKALQRNRRLVKVCHSYIYTMI